MGIIFVFCHTMLLHVAKRIDFYWGNIPSISVEQETRKKENLTHVKI